VLDRLVTEICLDRAGIDAVVRQLETAGMPQHVRVYLHIEPAASPARSTIAWNPRFWSTGRFIPRPGPAPVLPPPRSSTTAAMAASRKYGGKGNRVGTVSFISHVRDHDSPSWLLR
jgi:hypothetical protein